ncbi:STAS domain-containing protein [Dactylosporangium sp. CA-052675]|uniref:STAS domain-containing protein n=1 Tax=Dactylosporangium sp. CA-052675 TaxID=3239927 RepID=UPI003D8D7587
MSDPTRRVARSPYPAASPDSLRAASARAEQAMVDAELRATRRAVLSRFRHRLRTDVSAIAAPDFLVLADTPTVHTAIMIAACGIPAADACHLQLRDRGTLALRTVRHHGLPANLLDRFAAGDAGVASAGALAVRTGSPVLISDLTTSPVFAGRPALPVMLAAGTCSLHCYPLRDGGGRFVGVLSLHYATAGRYPSQHDFARHAGWALSNAAGAPPGPGGDDPARATTATVITDRATATTTVAVRGVLDAVTVPGFSELLRRTLASLGAPHTLVIDLREVDLLAAAAIRALLATSHLGHRRGLACRVVVGAGHGGRTLLGLAHAMEGPRVS